MVYEGKYHATDHAGEDALHALQGFPEADLSLIGADVDLGLVELFVNVLQLGHELLLLLAGGLVGGGDGGELLLELPLLRLGLVDELLHLGVPALVLLLGLREVLLTRLQVPELGLAGVPHL